MGNKKLHAKADEPTASSYSVLKYNAAELPKAYKNMVLSKYLRSLQAGNDFFKLILPKSFFTVHEVYFNTLLERPNAHIRMAVLSDDPDVVIGWSLTEPDKLHYVWVNGESRRRGIGTTLLPEEFNVITHFTKYFIPIWNRKYPKAVFNPYS